MLKKGFSSLKSLSKSQNVVFTSNPTQFEIAGVNFLGSSGENIKDMQAYAKFDSSLHALKTTLKINHIAPTCPDTLRCYPFTTKDPLVITQTPHVYFACNADKFDSE